MSSLLAETKIIHISAGQSLELVLEDQGVEAHLGENANFVLMQIQKNKNAGPKTVQNHFYLEKNAKLSFISFSHGDQEVVNEHTVEFQGEGGEADLKGLSLLTGRASISHKALIEHAKPNCKSRQVFKNILLDESSSNFSSLVHVHKNASKSDSQQLNKNLLLSDAAHAEARPELKIENDDVACTHGATVGQMDEREIFYLKSRGLSDEQARSLLVFGFAEEILQAILPVDLRNKLENEVRVNLSNTQSSAGS